MKNAITISALLWLGSVSASTTSTKRLRKNANQGQGHRQAQSFSAWTVNLWGLDSYSCGEAGSSVSIPVGQAISLERAPSNTVCLLQQSGPHGRTLARSFDGSKWELRVPLVQDTYLQIQECDDDACTVEVPALDGDNHDYHLVSFQGGSQSRTPEEKRNEIARFLIQSTFGPRLEDIDNFQGSYPDWIQQQIDLPVSGHRQYYREGSSYEVRGGDPNPENVCKVGSRWSVNPFGAQDHGKTFSISRNGNQNVVSIQGVPRTQYSQQSDCPQEANGKKVCKVWTATSVNLEQRCGGGQQDLTICDNSGIKFPRGGPPPDSMVTFSGDCEFLDLHNLRTKIKIFRGGQNCQCTLPSPANGKNFLANIGGTLHRFEEMQSFAHNTLEEPDQQGCASVPPSPINFDHCIVVPGSCEGRPAQHVPSDQYMLSCGSPGEVRANPEFGAIFRGNVQDSPYDKVGVGIDGPQGEPKTIWLQRVVYAKDQLRQRVAFALSELFVADLHSTKQSESALSFYDIFVRFAFGNYFDIMREVSYSPPMAEYLTYLGSSSFAASGFAPDENYGRELLQLFTVGPYLLYPNASYIVGHDGEPIPTYDEDDIETMARVWTGFALGERRLSENGGLYAQYTDPLRIIPELHDQFPKRNIMGGYIGDGYPLCYEFPAQDFLKSGASFEFYPDNDDEQGVQLAEGTPLYEALCNRNETTGLCNFQAKTTLSTNLGCDGLCDLQTVDLVRIGTATFRYVGRPCVKFAFFNNGEETDDGYCLDPAWKTSCCGSQLRRVEWNGVPCSPQARIMPDGKVAIVHDVTAGVMNEVSREHVNGTNLNFFRAVWAPGSKESLPTPGNCGVCEEHEGSCVCKVQEVRETVFNSAPTRSEILENLHVGSVPPEAFSSGEYVLHSVEQGGVTIFRKATGSAFDADTIFAVDHIPGQPETKYFRNVVSYVAIQGAPNLKFRNPPMFNSIVREGNTDTLGAYQEIDALLYHLLQHPNIAPFVSFRMIQRFVTSNPSVGYIERVTQAFESGLYGTFGTGKKGDMAATIAAVLLDDEARSVTLDGDPTQGQLREPLIKLIHIMRSLEIVNRKDNRFLTLPGDIQEYFSQFVYEVPSVFSFFEPDFSRTGSVLERQALIAPESRILGYTEFFRFFNLLIFQFTNGWNFPMLENYTENDVEEILDLLNLLFTGGRIGEEERQMILDAYHSAAQASPRDNWKTRYLRLVYAVALSTEFQITNLNYHIPDQLLPSPPPLPVGRSPATDFKAIVFIDLMGGADSLNMLVPHSECQGEDWYEKYVQTRPGVALSKSQLNVIDVSANQQVCNKYGMPTEMAQLHQMYLDKDMLWVGDVGSLLGGPDYEWPLGVSNHLIMQRHMFRGWANAFNDTGVLGRVADVLGDQGYRAKKFTTQGWGPTLSGDQDRSEAAFLVSPDGVPSLEGFYDAVYDVTAPGSSVFSQYYRNQLDQGRAQADLVNRAFRDSTVGDFPDDDLSSQMRSIARLIQERDEIGMDRALFTAELPKWDMHSGQAGKFSEQVARVDDAVGAFATEMKRQGLFDKVVVIMRTEFGRTHTSNSNKGTDHGWNGNYFVVGGSVKGGQMLGGQIDYGTYAPVYPWEAIYKGVFEWFGVLPHQFDEALPRHKYFDNLYSMEDLMES